MGTEYLIIILLWCGQPSAYTRISEVNACRKEAIACVRGLKNFNTDDVIAKCLK